MATITLTTSYQQISSFNLTYGTIKTYAKYSTQNTTTRKTNVQLKSVFVMASGWTSYSFDSATAKLDGTTKSYTSRTTFSSGSTTIQTKTIELSHNTSGTSETKSIATSWSASFGGSGSASGSIKAPKMDLYPMILTAPTFTCDYTGDVISISNPSITYTTSETYTSMAVTCGIYATTDTTFSNALVTPRTIDMNTNEFVFSDLTQEEKENLARASKDSRGGLSVTYRLVSVGTATNSHTMPTLMQVTNANPTYVPTIVENNTKVTNLIGGSSTNPSTLIKNASNITLTIAVTPKLYASVSSVVVTQKDASNNTITYQPTSISGNTYTFGDMVVMNNSFGVLITDSRGTNNTPDTQTITKTALDYIPANITNPVVKRPTPASDNVRITYTSPYQSTIGSYNNTIYLAYKKSTDTTWKQISSGYTISGGTLSVDFTTSTDEFSHNYQWNVDLKLEDALIPDLENNKYVPNGIPVFDYGAHDLQVNGNLIVADTNRENPINVRDKIEPVVLFEGNNNGTITLTDDYSNYSYIEVYALVNYNSYDHIVSVYNKIDTSTTNVCDLYYVTYHSNDYTQTRYCYLTFNGTSVSHSTERYGIIRSNSSTGTGSSNLIYVKKIIGYK